MEWFWIGVLAMWAITELVKFRAWLFDRLPTTEEDTEEFPYTFLDSSLSFDAYQALAAENAVYNGAGQPVPGIYTSLGLNGEAGEVAEKIKKYWRDGGDEETVREAVRKELGDVLWYTAMTAEEWDLSFEDVARANLEKLRDRRERGVLHGQGDNR